MLVLAELLIPIHNATLQRKTRQRKVRYDCQFSNTLPGGVKQPRLGIGPLPFDCSFGDIQALRHFAVGQPAKKFHRDHARLFRVFSLKALQRFVDQQDLVVRRRVGEFQSLNVAAHLSAAVLEPGPAPGSLNQYSAHGF